MALTGIENGLTVGLETFIETARSVWPAGAAAPQVLTRAPGRLDFMGGMADFSGALALQIPTDCAALVAVGLRDDQCVHVQTIDFNSDGSPLAFEWPLALLYQPDGQIATPEAFAAHFDACPWVRHIAGVCHSLLESGGITHFAGGMTIVLKSDIPTQAGLASSAAVQVAVAKALAALFEPELSDQQLLTACRIANTAIAGAVPGLVDHLTCLKGEADTLLQIRCQPDDILGTVALPDGVRVVAVDSAVRLPIYHQRYADNRIASLLGKCIIDRLLLQSGEIGDPTGGYLANIAPSEYVRRFRNELPVKIRGRDFFAQYGTPESLDVDIDPDRIYKVRSRTEHHIYENDRTHRFVDRLARTRRTGERDALIEAGDLMYASHWSYGQRCGMGSIETDILVNCIRERGNAKGLFGAKATGAGCGGSVAVLMADQPAAYQALADACSAYAEKTDKTATILQGSSPGAAAFGVRNPN